MRYYCLILISLFLICACNDQTTQETKDPNPPPFPNRVGTSWIYSITNEGNGEVDTVWIEITGVVTMPNNRQASVWTHTLADDLTITQYTAIIADTVFMFGFLDEPNLFKQYVFPLDIGRHWHSYNNKDSTHVVVKNKVTTSSGTYNKAYNLQRRTDRENDRVLEEDFWFVPDIGMVKNTSMLVGADIFPNIITWELLQYNRPPWDDGNN